MHGFVVTRDRKVAMLYGFSGIDGVNAGYLQCQWTTVGNIIRDSDCINSVQ